MKKIICIDPGHGGNDDGALGPNGLRECEIVLAIANLLSGMLVGDGLDVIMTRKTDVMVSLSDRCGISNKAKADLFLSIHCNSNDKPAAGIETWVSPATHSNFGQVIQDALVAEFPESPNRGVKSGDLFVLNRTVAAAALGECEFIHTPAGEHLLIDPKTQLRFARALRAAVLKQLGIANVPITSLPHDVQAMPEHSDPVSTPVQDARSEAVIAQLDPKCRQNFRAFLGEAKTIAQRYGCDYQFVSGYRSWAEQTELYAQGRTKPGPIVTHAPAGYSFHNFRTTTDGGCFTASGIYLDGGTASQQALAEKVHAACGAIAAKYGLEWGGNWQSIKDTPHMQFNVGHSSPTAEDRDKFSTQGTIL